MGYLNLFHFFFYYYLAKKPDIHPINEFQILRQELKLFDPKLAQKPFIIALNKIDEEDKEMIERRVIIQNSRALKISRALKNSRALASEFLKAKIFMTSEPM